jgi:Fuc2NAc and GlcNAc transferase
MSLAGTVLAGIFFGALGAFLIARFGPRIGLIDCPRAQSSHVGRIPKGAGVGILAALTAGAVYWGIPWISWIPAAFVSLVSLREDFREMPYTVRLAAQLGAAAVFIIIALFRSAPATASFGLVLLFSIIAVLYIAATANYFNFMDGINGIASLTGLIAFAAIGLYGLALGRPANLVNVPFIVAAACLGILPFNFPKAAVFLGDAGSVLLGFLYASWTLMFSRTELELVFLASFLMPFYIDELSTLLVRLKNHEKMTQVHKRHIYQILANQAGLPQALVTLLYAAAQILIIAGAWLALGRGGAWLFGYLVGVTMLGLLLGGRIRRRWERGGTGSGVRYT